MSIVALFLKKYWRELAAVALLSFAAWRGYTAVYERGVRDERAAWQTKENRALVAAVAERDKARATEQALAAKLAQIAERYEQEKRAAERESSAVIAGLRNGSIRLRNRWQGCEATSRVSGAAASAAESDAAARDREESAARIIGAARDADNQIRALQKVIEAERAKQ